MVYSSYAYYSKTSVKRPLPKRPKIGFQDQSSLNAGQTYCRMLQGEHSAILSTSLSYHLSLRSLFCLFLSGRFYTGITVFLVGMSVKLSPSLWHIEHAHYTHGILEDFKQGIC